jgi:hypothetical protein
MYIVTDTGVRQCLHSKCDHVALGLGVPSSREAGSCLSALPLVPAVSLHSPSLPSSRMSLSSTLASQTQQRCAGRTRVFAQARHTTCPQTATVSLSFFLSFLLFFLAGSSLSPFSVGAGADTRDASSTAPDALVSSLVHDGHVGFPSFSLLPGG